MYTFLHRDLFENSTPATVYVLEGGVICLETKKEALLLPTIRSSFVHVYKPYWRIEVDTPDGPVWLSLRAYDEVVSVTFTEPPDSVQWEPTTPFSSWAEFERTHQPQWTATAAQNQHVFSSSVWALSIMVALLSTVSYMWV